MLLHPEAGRQLLTDNRQQSALSGIFLYHCRIMWRWRRPELLRSGLDFGDLARPVRRHLDAVRRGEVFILQPRAEPGILRACRGGLREEGGALGTLADDLVDVA